MAEQTERRAGPAAVAAAYGLGLAAIAGGASGLVRKEPLHHLLLDAAVAVAAVVVLAAVVSMAWTGARTRTLRRISEGLEPIMRLDVSAPGKGLKAGRWRGSRPRRPTRLTLTYVPGFDDRDPKKRLEVEQILSSRLDAEVTLEWYPGRTQLKVRAEVSGKPLPLAVPEPEEVPSGPEARLLEVAQSVFGAGTPVILDGPPGWSDDGHLCRVRLRYATTSRDTSPQFRQRLLAQIDAKIPGQWADVWDVAYNAVEFAWREPFPENVRFPIHAPLKANCLPHAVTATGEILTWTLGSRSPHALVVGSTGTGKTVYIRNLVTAAALLGLPVIICDPKRIEFREFADWPNVTVLTDPREIAEAIRGAHKEMMARYGAIENGASRDAFPRMLFVLDEYLVFKLLLESVWAQMRAADPSLKGRFHPCLADWTQLVVLARTARIHLVTGIQRPDAEVVNGAVRDQLRQRTSLGSLSREGAIMMWDNARTGTALPSVQGRAITTGPTGSAIEAQALRLLTPGDDDYDAADAQLWQEITHRIHAAGPDRLAQESLARVTGRTLPVQDLQPLSADELASPTDALVLDNAPAASTALPFSTAAAQVTTASQLAPGDQVLLPGVGAVLVEETWETGDGIELRYRHPDSGAMTTLVLPADAPVELLDDTRPTAGPAPSPAAGSGLRQLPQPVQDSPQPERAVTEEDDWQAGAALEAVRAVDLQPGDTVYLEDETGIPELVYIDDVTDTDDGDVEISYSPLEDDGEPGTIALDPDTTLQRRTSR